MESSVKPNQEQQLRVALVAGEESGDILGSGLMAALKKRYPSIQFEGVGGSRMESQGLKSAFPMERLSIMGLVEVLKRYRELSGRRKRLISAWLQNPPDIFIGIDAPDFNLGIEEKLKAAGIPTAHYVSPSVWAWRQKRIKKIERAVDLMLCFLPFEAKFYERTRVDARFIGHPLANRYPIGVSQAESRVKLGLQSDLEVLALLPGSRGSEVEKLAPAFLKTARWLTERRPGLQFVVPAANDARYQQLTHLTATYGQGLNLLLTRSNSDQVLNACDAVLIASGTATLEAMLTNRPMVVAYKMAGLTFKIIRRLLKSRYISLPNLLGNEALVPEVLQDDVCPEVLGPLLLRALDDSAYRAFLEERFGALSDQIRMDADEGASEAVCSLLTQRGVV